MSNGTTPIYINVGGDKDSDTTRIRRASLVGLMATSTSLYQSDPAFKDSIDNFVQAGVDLAKAESDVGHLEQELAKSRGVRENKRSVYDKTHNVCTAKVANHSTSPEDVQSYGFSVLEKSAQGLLRPSEIQAKYDSAKGVIRIRVLCPSSRHPCAIEMSLTPEDPATFVRLEGSGRTRVLQGYAQGTWWIRASTLGSQKQSEWFGPVAVIVK